ncbi:hypothetical protein TELCIR_13419, partial [Teladorsagia circumcincta]
VSIGDEGEENNRSTAESEESEEESESSEDEESSESDSSESDGESSSDDSDSTDSLWGAFEDGDKKQTQEANEASALLEFQRALDCLVKGKNAAATKILKRLLNNPLVKGFNTTVFDWEAEVDESEFCDKIFGENRRYDLVETLDEATTAQIAQRLNAVEERLRAIPYEEEIPPPSPIDIEFDAEQTVDNVATCFCDLYDRVEAYSSLSLQEFTFSRWDDRRDLLDSMSVLQDIVDVIDAVNCIIDQASSKNARARLTSLSTSTSASDSFLRRSMRYAMELPFYEESSPLVVDTSAPCRLDGKLPPLEVIAIITRDIDFHALDGDDLFETAEFLIEAYLKVRSFDAAVEFMSRLFHLLLSYKQLPYEQIASLQSSVREVDWSKVKKENAEVMGYFLCQLTTIDRFGTDWLVWKELYRVAERIGGGISVDYIHSLDPIKQDEAMPSLGLDVLLKAHEKLGEAKVCGHDKGAFLLFYMEKLHACISNESVVSVLRRDDFSWLWSNVSEEISQCLYCVFGRYSKRRRALEDHECIVGHRFLDKHSTMVIELAMPHPMPQYDDKDRLGHDVVDLLLNKFPFMLKYSDERKKVMEKFTTWMHRAATDTSVDRLKWPTEKDESYVQSCVWYLMALHHYRSSNYNEIETYSKLFLTSGHATLESRVTAGAWAVLAYTSVYRVFQMDDDMLYLEWPWHVMPFRISLLVDGSIGVVYFQLANTLYQIATRLSRYFLTLPSDDWRLRRAESLLRSIRKESFEHFEEALSKVVDSMFEAACSCELSEFFYPIKINVKKQQNIEPVELHYQIHAVVWKYLCKNPEIHETVVQMTVDCDRQRKGDVVQTVDDIITRVDLIEELWNLCHRGFELVCERFPHMKSYYRLAEMELSRGNVEAAYGHLMKHVFRKKKRDDSLFDSVVEITSQDIDRSGSFPYHVERALQLLSSLAYRLKDIPAIVSIITALVANMETRNE